MGGFLSKKVKVAPETEALVSARVSISAPARLDAAGLDGTIPMTGVEVPEAGTPQAVPSPHKPHAGRAVSADAAFANAGPLVSQICGLWPVACLKPSATAPAPSPVPAHLVRQTSYCNPCAY